MRRWGTPVPPRDRSRQPLPVCDKWVRWCLKDGRWIKTIRERLQSLSGFLKCLKEPLARLANRQDETRGAFFENRFQSVTFLDEEAFLAVGASIDPNPVAAGVVRVPEARLLVDYTGRLSRDGKGAICASSRGSLIGWGAARRTGGGGWRSSPGKGGG